MRVCDICHKPATDRIKIERQQQEFDLCEEHVQKVLETMQRIEDRPNGLTEKRIRDNPG